MSGIFGGRLKGMGWAWVFFCMYNWSTGLNGNGMGHSYENRLLTTRRLTLFRCGYVCRGLKTWDSLSCPKGFESQRVQDKHSPVDAGWM